MREKVIEQKLVSEVKKRGGICPKWVCPSYDGMPDRLVLLPPMPGEDQGHLGMIECKAPGQKPRPLQLSRHKLLEQLGLSLIHI